MGVIVINVSAFVAVLYFGRRHSNSLLIKLPVDNIALVEHLLILIYIYIYIYVTELWKVRGLMPTLVGKCFSFCFVCGLCAIHSACQCIFAVCFPNGACCS